MNRLLVGTSLVVTLVSGNAWAYQTDCIATDQTPTYKERESVPCRQDKQGNSFVTQGTTTAGEDVPNDIVKTESRFLVIPFGGTTSRISADQLYRSGFGYVKGISCYSDAAATAGTVELRDSTVAGAGNILWSFDVLVADYSRPFEVNLETPYAQGLFLDFTTTSDMNCTVRYR